MSLPHTPPWVVLFDRSDPHDEEDAWQDLERRLGHAPANASNGFSLPDRPTPPRGAPPTGGAPKGANA